MRKCGAESRGGPGPGPWPWPTHGDQRDRTSHKSRIATALLCPARVRSLRSTMHSRAPLMLHAFTAVVHATEGSACRCSIAVGALGMSLASLASGRGAGRKRGHAVQRAHRLSHRVTAHRLILRPWPDTPGAGAQGTRRGQCTHRAYCFQTCRRLRLAAGRAGAQALARAQRHVASASVLTHLHLAGVPARTTAAVVTDLAPTRLSADGASSEKGGRGPGRVRRTALV